MLWQKARQEMSISQMAKTQKCMKKCKKLRKAYEPLDGLSL